MEVGILKKYSRKFRGEREGEVRGADVHFVWSLSQFLFWGSGAMAIPNINPRTGSFFLLDKQSISPALPVDKEVSPYNPNISRGKEDVLYHLGLSNHQDLEGLFGDVKFVCMGGSAKRMHIFAQLLVEKGLVKIPAGFEVAPIGKTERYSLYKVNLD